VLTLDSVSRDLVAVGTSADPDHPQDIVRYSLRQPGQIVKLTDVNGDVLEGKQIAKTEKSGTRPAATRASRVGS
jgi:hypothetical protein